MNVISFEDIEIYFPPYLSITSKEELFKGLKQFNHEDFSSFYLFDNIEKLNTQWAQGDSVSELDFNGTNREALLISNTCDMSLENDRNIPIHVSYVPIAKVKTVLEMLKEGRHCQSYIKTFIANLKKQKYTNLFYLPSVNPSSEDKVAFLDMTHSCDKDNLPAPSANKVFCMGNTGFYLFLFKLSVHFTRMMEGLDRSPTNN